MTTRHRAARPTTSATEGAPGAPSETPDMRAALSELAAELHTLRGAAEASLDLATRLDNVEHDLAAAQARVETLTTLAALGAPEQPDAARGYQHPNLHAWVDDVFSRLAARHQARWCPQWAEHLEAVHRLNLLWHTWENAHTEPANWAARDEWTRLIFDHHTGWLLDREGPFAGCTPHLCALAPRLPQQRHDTDQRAVLVASLDARRRVAAAAVGTSR